MDHSRDWATRCVLEASMHEKNCFVTLTYAKTGKNLNKEDFVRFMKYLRKEYGAGIRFFHCGEYGTEGNRPHHHACIFNHQFPDLELWQIREGVKLYRSASLEKIWGHGYCTVGEVTFESAAYVARYVMKKIEKQNHEVAEYVTMSRRPGIASKWYDTYRQDILKIDSIKMQEGTFRTPRYFDNKIKSENKTLYERIKHKRKQKINTKDSTPERLAVREKIKKLKLKQLKRGYENG